MDEQAAAQSNEHVGLAQGTPERVKEFHKTEEGSLLASMVAEYLEWCGMAYTAQVFVPESGMQANTLRRPRTQLAAEVGVASNNDEPLLAQLLRTRVDSPAAVLAAASKTNEPAASSMGNARQRPESAYGTSSAPSATKQTASATTTSPVAATTPEATEAEPPKIKPLPGSLAPLGGGKASLAPLAPLRPTGGGLGGGGGGGLAPLRGAPRVESPRASLADSDDGGLPPARPASAYAEEFLENSNVDSEVMELDEEIEEIDDEDIEIDDESLPDDLDDAEASTQDFRTSMAEASVQSGVLASDDSGEIDQQRVDFVESAEI